MGWTSWVEDAYFLYPPEDPECLKYHYITKTAEDKPQLSIEQETEKMNQQIEESEGFDIDFSMFRSLFNYHLVDLDDHDFVDEPETNADLMKKLSQESIKRYNEESDIPAGSKHYEMFWEDELREVIDQGARRICWIVASTGDLSAQLKLEGKVRSLKHLSLLHLLVGLRNKTDDKGGSKFVSPP